jgi:tetratricopeptide (TPR) repeat protein
MPAERPPCTDDAMQRSPHSEAVGRGESLDVALCRQREDWQNGIRIPIAERLKAWEADCDDPANAAELIYQDILLQRDFGAAPNWDSVLRGFPQYAEQLQHLRDADEIVEAAFDSADPRVAQPVGYELFEEVGRGGMGVVYRAREHSLDRMVAIKRIRGCTAGDDQAIGRFLKEAKSVSRLNHPNIIHIYRVGDCDGEPFIALEFVGGPTLGQRVSGTPLMARLAATISAAVARAIQHAHEHGIIHRDLKPANILLAGTSDEPVPKVSDFGAAKELDHASDRPATQFLGTPSYMAPEQVETKWGMVSALTDIYGIGALLYESLTGRPPFRADSVGKTLRQVVETDPVSPRLLNPTVPRDLETICLKCLSKEPSHRYGSAAALADDLERFIGGQPIHARPSSSGARAWMWCRRKPGTAMLAAALALAFICGTAGVALQWRRAETARKDAVASDLEAQELLGELVQMSHARPGTRDRTATTSLDALQRAETHCRNLLSKHPHEMPIRIALTKVYGAMGSYHVELGEGAKAEDSYRQAQRLWEPLAANPGSSAECRDWLATTYFWQDGDDSSRRVQSLSHAVAIWQQLAADEPDDLDFMHRIWECRRQMAFHTTSKLGRDHCLHFLESDRDELVALLLRDPNSASLRGRLALTSFLLGEIYRKNELRDKADAAWRQSYNHYSALAKGRHADFLSDIWLAISCSRLIQGGAADPYYQQAVPLLEKGTQRIETLLKRGPQNDWLRAALLQGYCCLASCHVKAGQAAKADRIATDRVSALALPVDIDRLERDAVLDEALTLTRTGQWLREANLTSAALRLARQAGTMCSRLAAYPSRTCGFLGQLASTLMDCSALANQLGDGHLSLEQAELARRTLEELICCAPARDQEQFQLSAAWMRIAKAHWTLGDLDKAWAALLQSTAVQRRLFEREPSNPSYRAWLSQCYDRLVFYGSRAGKLDGAAGAILERSKLWPEDPMKLIQSAEDFASLAEQVIGRRHAKLSPEDQAERDRYLAESRHAREAADAAARHEISNLRVER